MAQVLTNLSNALSETVAAVSPGVVRVDARERLPASGILWDTGVVVTSHHVVERDENLFVGLASGEKVSVTLAGRDPSTDLAVLRIQATGIDQGSALFIGIGPGADVEAYLSGVAHDEIREVESDGDIKYRSIAGTASPAPPAEPGFWVASASGARAPARIGEFSAGTCAPGRATAAAEGPGAKFSAAVVAMKGMSGWVGGSMPAGRT